MAGAAETHLEDQLSRDVDALGRLLGEVLREQEGDDGFALVEEYRARTKALRAADAEPEDFDDAGQRLLQRTDELGLERVRLVVRAFTAYFHLVNLAEEHHRLRVLRERERTGGTRGESIPEAIEEASHAGVPVTRFQRLLASCVVEPVFTAHPTEARRRTVLDKLRRLGELVDALDDPRQPPSERSRLQDRAREEITALWLTEEVRRRAPTVLDEVRNGLYYFEQSLWHVVPRLYRELEASLAAAYPGQAITVPPFLRFGSWVGGDRDGNPSVTADVTEATLRLHKETAIALHERTLEELQEHLSVATGVAASHRPVPESLARSLAADAAAMPALDEARAAERYAGEPYRQKLGVIRARLSAARRLNQAKLAAGPEAPPVDPRDER